MTTPTPPSTTADAFAAFVARAPAEAREHLEPSVPRDADATATWRQRVRDHLATCAAESTDNEFLDLATAEATGNALLALATALDDAGWTDAARAIWLAAARYFVETDDGDHDFHSVIGFEDDAEVTLAACDTLAGTVSADRRFATAVERLRALLP